MLRGGGELTHSDSGTSQPCGSQETAKCKREFWAGGEQSGFIPLGRAKEL